MKKNKGFSLLELIVAFGLTMLLVGLLFEIIFSLKEVYEKSAIKTELLNHQNILVDKIYSDLNNDVLTRINACGEDCLMLTYQSLGDKQLLIDRTTNVVSYGNYSFNIMEGSSFGSFYICNNGFGIENYRPKNILNLKLEIFNRLYGQTEFGANILYLFNKDDINFDYTNCPY